MPDAERLARSAKEQRLRTALADKYRHEAQGFEHIAVALEIAGGAGERIRPMVEEARKMAAAKRRAASALVSKRDPLSELRRSRRTTRECVNRRRRDVGLRPLPLRLRRLRPIRRRDRRPGACSPRPRGRRVRTAAHRGSTRGSPDPDPHLAEPQRGRP